jgi:hypothetical protein
MSRCMVTPGRPPRGGLASPALARVCLLVEFAKARASPLLALAEPGEFLLQEASIDRLDMSPGWWLQIRQAVARSLQDLLGREDQLLIGVEPCLRLVLGRSRARVRREERSRRPSTPNSW